MKAVNLIPKDSRRGRGGATGLGFSPSYAVLGVLVVALIFAVIYVLSSNSISDRKAKLASVQAQLASQQALDARLTKYVQFEKLAQARVQTVREIAAARFDWYTALTNLSKVVPADTSLSALAGTVAPGASTSGSSGGAASGLRADESVPAFELTGCTKTQDDVARLMSRLRLVDGVTRVTLGSSQKEGTNSTSDAGGATSSVGCGLNGPAFDLVVFFQPLAGAGATGVTSVSATPTSTSGATSSAATPASTTSGTATTATTTSTTPTTTTAGTPASTTTGAGK